MRALFIDDEARRKVDRVIAYAMDHPFYPGKSPTPGDIPGYVAFLNTYRCVFTFTRTRGMIYRHLTISVPPENKYPNPVAAFLIAQLFGFTGYNDKKPEVPGPDWMMDIRDDENCIMIVQET